MLISNLSKKTLGTSLLSVQTIKTGQVGRKPLNYVVKKLEKKSQLLKNSLRRLKLINRLQPKKRGRESEGRSSPSKKKKTSSSTSPSRRSASPKKTARRASTGKSPKSKSSTKKTTKKTIIKPVLETNETLLKEFHDSLNRYNDNKENDKVLHLLNVISNFAIDDIALLSTVRIGKVIRKLTKSDDAKIQKAATKIYDYYDSLVVSREEAEKKSEDADNNNNNDNSEKKEDDNITTEVKADDPPSDEIKDKSNNDVDIVVENAKVEDKMETETKSDEINQTPANPASDVVVQENTSN